MAVSLDAAAAVVDALLARADLPGERIDWVPLAAAGRMVCAFGLRMDSVPTAETDRIVSLHEAVLQRSLNLRQKVPQLDASSGSYQLHLREAYAVPLQVASSLCANLLESPRVQPRSDRFPEDYQCLRRAAQVVRTWARDFEGLEPDGLPLDNQPLYDLGGGGDAEGDHRTRRWLGPLESSYTSIFAGCDVVDGFRLLARVFQSLMRWEGQDAVWEVERMEKNRGAAWVPQGDELQARYLADLRIRLCCRLSRLLAPETPQQDLPTLRLEAARLHLKYVQNVGRAILYRVRWRDPRFGQQAAHRERVRRHAMRLFLPVHCHRLFELQVLAVWLPSQCEFAMHGHPYVPPLYCTRYDPRCRALATDPCERELCTIGMEQSAAHMELYEILAQCTLAEREPLHERFEVLRECLWICEDLDVLGSREGSSTVYWNLLQCAEQLAPQPNNPFACMHEAILASFAVLWVGHRVLPQLRASRRILLRHSLPEKEAAAEARYDAYCMHRACGDGPAPGPHPWAPSRRAEGDLNEEWDSPVPPAGGVLLGGSLHELYLRSVNEYRPSGGWIYAEQDLPAAWLHARRSRRGMRMTEHVVPGQDLAVLPPPHELEARIVKMKELAHSLLSAPLTPRFLRGLGRILTEVYAETESVPRHLLVTSSLEGAWVEELVSLLCRVRRWLMPQFSSHRWRRSVGQLASFEALGDVQDESLEDHELVLLHDAAALAPTLDQLTAYLRELFATPHPVARRHLPATFHNAQRAFDEYCAVASSDGWTLWLCSVGGPPAPPMSGRLIKLYQEVSELMGFLLWAAQDGYLPDAEEYLAQLRQRLDVGDDEPFHSIQQLLVPMPSGDAHIEPCERWGFVAARGRSVYNIGPFPRPIGLPPQWRAPGPDFWREQRDLARDRDYHCRLRWRPCLDPVHRFSLESLDYVDYRNRADFLLDGRWRRTWPSPLVSPLTQRAYTDIRVRQYIRALEEAMTVHSIDYHTLAPTDQRLLDSYDHPGDVVAAAVVRWPSGNGPMAAPDHADQPAEFDPLGGVVPNLG